MEMVLLPALWSRCCCTVLCVCLACERCCVQAMEEEVNVFYDELLQGCTAQQGYNLLSLQVRKLQMCLDIYVSTEASHSTKGGKICFRSQRGR